MASQAHTQPDGNLDVRIQRLAEDTKTVCEKDATDRRSMEALKMIYSRWQTPQAPVVLAGEVSVGKSMLINALVGEPLLPTDFRAWTSTWARIHYAPGFRASAGIQADGKLVQLPVNRSDLDTYLTVEGVPAVQRRHGKAAKVSWVDIGLPVPLLRDGLELVDTPGVGGLRAAHRHTALSALTYADAVIFVSKPDTPISASERLFLAEAVKRVAVCVIVFTRRDKLAAPDAAVVADTAVLTDAAQWESLGLDPEQSGLLARRFTSVPAVSVSSVNRLEAAAHSPGPGRGELEALSNMAVLEDILQHDVVSRIGTIHRQNVVALCRLLTDSHAGNAHQRASLLRGDEQARRALEQREETVHKWTASGGDYWRKVFDDECGTLPGKFASFAKTRAGELRREYRVALQTMSLADIRAAAEEIGNAPESALSDMVAIARTTLDQALVNVRELLQADGDLSGPLEAMSKTRDVERKLRQDDFNEGKLQPGIVELRAALTGGMVGVGGTAAIAGHLGVVAAAAPIFWPFAIGALAFGGYQLWQRRRQNTALKAIEYLDQVCELVTKKAVELAVQAAAEAADKLRQEISAGLHDLASQITEDRRLLQESGKLVGSPAQREERIKELTDSARQGEMLRAAAEQLATELS
jgi:hypothetical protein